MPFHTVSSTWDTFTISWKYPAHFVFPYPPGSLLWLSRLGQGLLWELPFLAHSSGPKFFSFLVCCKAAEGSMKAGLWLFYSTLGSQRSLQRHLWNGWVRKEPSSTPLPCPGALCTLVKHLGFPSGSVRVPPNWAGSSSGLMSFSKSSFQLPGSRGVERWLLGVERTCHSPIPTRRLLAW